MLSTRLLGFLISLVPWQTWSSSSALLNRPMRWQFHVEMAFWWSRSPWSSFGLSSTLTFLTPWQLFWRSTTMSSTLIASSVVLKVKKFPKGRKIALQPNGCGYLQHQHWQIWRTNVPTGPGFKKQHKIKSKDMFFTFPAQQDHFECWKFFAPPRWSWRAVVDWLFGGALHCPHEHRAVWIWQWWFRQRIWSARSDDSWWPVASLLHGHARVTGHLGETAQDPRSFGKRSLFQQGPWFTILCLGALRAL